LCRETWYRNASRLEGAIGAGWAGLTLYYGIGLKLEFMRIGELARKAGVNVQTIRFYERRRLLREPMRTAGGYRNYERADLESLIFIKWCQPLGFTLKEVRELLRLHAAVASFTAGRGGGKPSELESIVRMGEEKLASIDEKVKSLKKMEKQLRLVIQELQKQRGPVCPASKPRRRILSR
jgi:DNA-binding transcriptional MerR regulator